MRSVGISRKLVLVAAFGAWGCSGPSGDGGGSGGYTSPPAGSGGSASGGSSGGPAAFGGATTPSGGATGSGGTPAAGAATGAGGISTSGGVTTLGGMTGSGGRTRPPGATGSGGLTAAGGRTGRGTGGAPAAGGTNGSTGQPDAEASRDARSPDAGTDAAKDAAVDGLAPQPDAADAKPAQCPSTNTLKAGDSSLTLQHGGRNRSYRVYVPSSVKSGTAVPLVFDFHGHGGSATQEESASGWKKKADQVGFVVVYPEGIDKSWNVGSCCGLAMSENVDDVGFTRAMIEAISKAACIDAKRVYATGMSNGAGFAQRLACQAADVIAAIAAASADLVTDPCTPARPISELSVRGLDDTMVAYAGGKTGSTGWYSPGAKGTLELWKEINECTGSVQTTRQYCETYSSCAAGVEITLCSLPDTGHDTYNNAVGMSVPDVAWEMFQRQPMP
jgi:poly(3-hydroxybutyrate) depolymerase